MPLEDTHAFRKAGSHARSPLHCSLNQYDLDVWSEFESAIPDLFVTEGYDCRAEMFEFTSSFSPSPPQLATAQGQPGPGNKQDTEEQITSVEGLKRVLHVRCHI